MKPTKIYPSKIFAYYGLYKFNGEYLSLKLKIIDVNVKNAGHTFKIISQYKSIISVKKILEKATDVGCAARGAAYTVWKDLDALQVYTLNIELLTKP